jgi:hypothetical protein
VIAKRAEEGLFVINDTVQNLPLTLLQLGDGAGQADGVDWGVPALRPGDCVVAWQDKDEPKLPDNVQCNQVGNVLIRSKSDAFWKQMFYVYYGGETVGGCDKEEKACAVRISSGSGYALHIAKRGEESLFVLNLSPRDFALSLLQLGDGAGQVSGVDWGEPTLGERECVTVWEDDRDARPPDGVLCKPIGEQLTRDKGDRFWSSTFGIYYDGSLVGTCDKERKHCFVHIPGD